MKIALIALTFLTTIGCQSYPYHGAHNPAYAGYSNQQRGAVTGGLAGAGIGGIVGHQSGRGLEGAAIGAGLGILSGAVLGNARDREQDLYSRGYRDGANASTGTQSSTSSQRVDTNQGDDYNDSYGQLPARRSGNSTVHVGVGYGSGYHGSGYGHLGFGHSYHRNHYHSGAWGNRYGHGRRGYCW